MTNAAAFANPLHPLTKLCSFFRGFPAGIGRIAE